MLVDRFQAHCWPAPDAGTERLAQPGFLLVGDPDDAAARLAPVGFVHVLEIEGHAHLEQVSVLPRFTGRGLGRMLVNAALAQARSRGHQEITLRTYADVPWNAPFYASCGFAVTEPPHPLPAAAGGRGGRPRTREARPARADDRAAVSARRVTFHDGGHARRSLCVWTAPHSSKPSSPARRTPATCTPRRRRAAL
ncbi:GNAT family N-acetyltransferase [Microbacterium sp. ARD32]|uniref:GNAT family N-acetyltransferase n=1 Tax=Microbacterium sp. ARD32 TaxID=2962577 RepID=UPI002889DB88|nr:GNAT family N-acetyltransferase [Microbacterium sp. ARD32]